MKTETHTTETPAEFTINAVVLKNMYQSFNDMMQPKFITGEDRTKSYKLAAEINFNSFKIYFKTQLEALNLNTELL